MGKLTKHSFVSASGTIKKYYIYIYMLLAILVEIFLLGALQSESLKRYHIKVVGNDRTVLVLQNVRKTCVWFERGDNILLPIILCC